MNQCQGAFKNSILMDDLKMQGYLRKKPGTPGELVGTTWQLLQSIDFSRHVDRDPWSREKRTLLTRNLHAMNLILYGSNEVEPKVEPVPNLCAQLIQFIYKRNTIRLMIQCVPHVTLEARKDTAEVLAYLQRESVHSRFITYDYLEKNMDLLDLVITQYKDPDIALQCGTMLRVSIRHQNVARFLLDSGGWKRLMTYINLLNFKVASDALATFENLLTTHTSTVAEYLKENYASFFDEYNSILLESRNYFTMWQGPNLLGRILVDRFHKSSMLRYISSQQNLIRIMNLMKGPNKRIRTEAFHVFKLFVANTHKPEHIVCILLASRAKLLGFLGDLSAGTEAEQLKRDIVMVTRELHSLGTFDDS